MKKYIFILVGLLTTQIRADAVVSVALEQGYNSNLFNDSLEFDDSYTSIITDILVYPFEIAEIDIFGDFYKYSKFNDLSNFNGGFSVTLIPTDVYCRSQIYLNSSLAFLNYGNDFKIYNTRTINANSSWNYLLSNKVTTKIGVGASSVSYTSSTSVDDRILYGFAGFNLTFFSKNSFDFETAYYNKKFLTDDSFNSKNSYVDLLARYSRPLSSSLGFKLSYLHRILSDAEDTFMPGFTVDYLSPWATLWSGEEVNLSLKKIFPQAIVVSLQYTYNNKEYINQLELDSSSQSMYSTSYREDYSNAYYLTIEKEISLNSKILIPQLYIYMQNNNSSNNYYTYNKLSIYGSLNLSF